MELMIKGKNFEVPEHLRNYAQRKINRLNRYLPNITEAKLELGLEDTRSGSRYVAQLTLVKKGTILRAEERSSDPYAAVDTSVDAMHRRVERYKGKLYGRGRAAAVRKSAPILETEAVTEEEELPGKVVRVKRFPVKPMTEDEAIEQLELLGHDFFLFLNADTNHLCVLYRRKDGDYGLLEPDLP